MQQPIRILIIDPLAPSRERLVEALSHRFDAVAVESRLKALDVLQKSKGIRLVLVSSFQLEWKGKQLARHIQRRLGADCPTIWHYGEVDGCARVSDVVASEYKKKYSIDRFLTATLAPVEIARAVGAHFHKELHEAKRATETFDEPTTGWGTFSFGGLKQALTTDIITPIDRLPRNGLSLIASMRLPTMPTCATRSNPVSGSMTRPLAMTKSYVRGGVEHAPSHNAHRPSTAHQCRRFKKTSDTV